MTTRKHRSAEKYGPWLDFLVLSTFDGNDQLSLALQELEISRYFISSSRFAATESTVYRPKKLPEPHDVEHDSHWPDDIIKKLREKRTSDGPIRERSTMLNRHSLRRTKPALTSWQSTGDTLYNMQNFCPQTEAECALSLILHRQELAVLRKEASRGNALRRNSSLVRAERCHCGSDMCENSESSSREASPSFEVSIKPLDVPAPLKGRLRLAVATILSVIIEEGSRPTTPRLERCSSKDTVSDTTLFGTTTPPDAPLASADLDGALQQVIVATETPVGQIMPSNDTSAAPTTEGRPQQSFTVDSAAAAGCQSGVPGTHDTDDEGQPGSSVHPPDLPSTPFNVLEALQQNPSAQTEATGLLQTGTTNLPTADGKETKVSKQIVEPEVIAENADGTAEACQKKTFPPKRQETGDSEYESIGPFQNEDGVEVNTAIGLLRGDALSRFIRHCAGVRDGRVWWREQYVSAALAGWGLLPPKIETVILDRLG
ncbi:hypothetical protein N431DRAFT_493907 [Stipitochalara longipes BDJ]|nr:hypothetical protein N431DRAFT_493907 [Stipitochalara longipes BDJ]